MSRRVGEPSRESAGRNRRSGLTHRPPPVAKLSRSAARRYRCPFQAHHPQGGPEQTNGAQLRNRKVSCRGSEKLPVHFLLPLLINHSSHPFRVVVALGVFLFKN